MAQQISLHTVWLANRPLRAAYIVAHDTDWEMLSSVIAHSCTWWGGPASIILPVGEDLSLSETSQVLLRAFDPDAVLTVEADAPDELRQHLRRHSAPFRINPIRLNEPPKGHGTQTPVESIPLVTAHLPGTVIVPGGGYGPRRALLESLFGTWSDSTADRIGAAVGSTVELFRYEPPPESSVLVDGIGHEIASATDGPLSASARGVAMAGLVPYQLLVGTREGLPPLLLIGDSPRDFCVVHSYHTLGGHCYWFPYDPLSIPSLTSHDHLLLHHPEVACWVRWIAERLRDAYTYSGGKTPLCLSSSFGDDQGGDRVAAVTEALRCWSGWADLSFRRIQSLTADEAQPVLRTYERGSVKCFPMQFVDGVATSALPVEVSEHAVHDDPTRVRWYFDVHIESTCLPTHDSVAGLLFRDDLSCNVVRVGTSQHTALQSIYSRIRSGSGISEVLRQAQLRMPSAAELFSEIMCSGGYLLTREVNAQYADSLLERFGGLPGAVDAVCDPYVYAIFELACDASANETGVHDRGVLLNSRAPRILDVTALERLSDETETDPARAKDVLNLLVMKRVLLRGLPLKCTTCSNTDWYELTDLGRSTICTRCRSPLWPLAWEAFAPSAGSRTGWPDPHFHYRLNEMLFQFWANHVGASLLGAHYYTRDTSHPLFLLEQKARRAEGGPATQLDWICVDRGDMVVGEAKTSDQLDSEDQEQIDKYCQLAIDVGTHVAYLTTCPEWSSGARQRLEHAQELLAEHELRLDILTGADVIPDCAPECPDSCG